MKAKTKIKISIGPVEFEVGSIGTLDVAWVREDPNWPLKFDGQPMIQVPSEYLELLEEPKQ
jgi:hypothetical protein